MNKDDYKDSYSKIEAVSEEAYFTQTNARSNLYVISPNRIELPTLNNEKSKYVISLDGVNCQYKRLLFSAINAGLYHSRQNYEDRGRSVLRNATHIFYFWNFIKSLPLTLEQFNQSIKLFESWRVQTQSLKVQSSGASTIILLMQMALIFADFRKTLNATNYDLLERLCQTKLAKHDPRAPVTLNHWFSQHTWLRRDDVGIGNDLYNRLSSPQALMNSFQVTLVSLLSFIQRSKDALISFFKDTQITKSNIEKVKPVSQFSSRNEQSLNTQRIIDNFFTLIKRKLKSNYKISPELSDAIELMVYSNCTSSFRNRCYQYLFSKNSNSSKIVYLTATSPEHPIFSISFLRSLASYSTNPTTKVMPVCEGETMIFGWLMANQTVQVSDISKLRLSDFSFMKRSSGKISHIECKYFKGRADGYHRLSTIDVSSDMGASILRYLLDKTGLTNTETLLVPNLRTAYLSGKMSLVSRLLLALEVSGAKTLYLNKLKTEKATPVFYQAYKTLMTNGRPNRSYVEPGELSVQNTTFGHAAIKTSAVYSSTHKFDPTTLINTNSHTNETEQNSYRDERNFEWDNICGRVTRAVMRDFYVNVFRPSQQENSVLKSEFTRAKDYISTKSQQVYATLKVVTNREGSVNEIGLSNNKTIDVGDLPDTIYLVDSAETVMKMKHYLAEVRLKHKTLNNCDPEYLFSTVLPTTEWIEMVFDKNVFSTESLQDGTALYEQFKSQLPPHFNHKLI